MKKLVGITFIPTLILLVVLIATPAFANGSPQVSTWSAAIAYFNPTGSSGETDSFLLSRGRNDLTLPPSSR